jgi:hypothetical protein
VINSFSSLLYSRTETRSYAKQSVEKKKAKSSMIAPISVPEEVHHHKKV